MESTKSPGDALKARIRHVPDFPKPGILFYDVTTLLKDHDGFRMAVDAMSAPHVGQHIDVVVGIESRGFIFGAAIADRLRAGFAPVRKLGKLPAKTQKASYSLEYGSDSLEIHVDAVKAGQRVLIVDDLLATGGTAAATLGLVKGLGGVVIGLQFLIELVALEGRAKVPGETIGVVLKY
jgi:adenine phosphoribosyltransferase